MCFFFKEIIRIIVHNLEILEQEATLKSNIAVPVWVIYVHY